MPRVLQATIFPATSTFDLDHDLDVERDHPPLPTSTENSAVIFHFSAGIRVGHVDGTVGL